VPGNQNGGVHRELAPLPIRENLNAANFIQLSRRQSQVGVDVMEVFDDPGLLDVQKPALQVEMIDS
jgi:hypothetical protein